MLPLSKKILLMLNFLILLTNYIMAECNTCQPKNKIACRDDTTFSICIDGVPTEDYIACPKDYHCTAEKFMCYPKTVDVAQCTPTTPATTPTTPVTTPTTTSTTIIGRDPLTICKDAQKNGFYTNELDLTCTTQVLCVKDVNSNEWSAQIINCGVGLWFNGVYCANKKPDYCQ